MIEKRFFFSNVLQADMLFTIEKIEKLLMFNQFIEFKIDAFCQ